MSSNDRVFNITRNYSMRAKQALRGIENCAMAWVEEGKSVRDLSLSESIKARSEQARMRTPLEYVEVFGLRFEPPAGTEKAHYAGRLLAYEASQFCKEVSA